MDINAIRGLHALRAEDDPQVSDVMRTKHGVVSWMQESLGPSSPKKQAVGGLLDPLLQDVPEGTDNHAEELAPDVCSSQDRMMLPSCCCGHS